MLEKTLQKWDNMSSWILLRTIQTHPLVQDINTHPTSSKLRCSLVLLIGTFCSWKVSVPQKLAHLIKNILTITKTRLVSNTLHMNHICGNIKSLSWRAVKAGQGRRIFAAQLVESNNKNLFYIFLGVTNGKESNFNAVKNASDNQRFYVSKQIPFFWIAIVKMDIQKCKKATVHFYVVDGPVHFLHYIIGTCLVPLCHSKMKWSI